MVVKGRGVRWIRVVDEQGVATVTRRAAARKSTEKSAYRIPSGVLPWLSASWPASSAGRFGTCCCRIVIMMAIFMAADGGGGMLVI